MNVSNVPSVFIKIDTFCDYIPFVSSVTNMVDLFQKCVILPLMQKSKIQTSHYYKHLDQKSFTRCSLLVIPIFGNIIIGIYDFSNRKYGNKESTLAFKPQNKDLLKIPDDITYEVVSYLNLHELGVSRLLSKGWNTFSSMPILWKAAIYREFAFSSKNWAEWDADIVRDVDMTQEMLSLPENIVEELRRSHKAFPGKSIRETHVLVRMPKGLTINKLGELAKKYFPFTPQGYKGIDRAIVNELGNKPADESVWLLMTTQEVDRTRNRTYIQQQRIVADLARKAQVPYQIPTTLEALTCILAEYSRSENRLINSDSSGLYIRYIRCQEKVQHWQIIVGNFSPTGLDVSYDNYGNVLPGVVALRKFC